MSRRPTARRIHRIMSPPTLPPSSPPLLFLLLGTLDNDSFIAHLARVAHRPSRPYFFLREADIPRRQFVCLWIVLRWSHRISFWSTVM